MNRNPKPLARSGLLSILLIVALAALLVVTGCAPSSTPAASYSISTPVGSTEELAANKDAGGSPPVSAPQVGTDSGDPDRAVGSDGVIVDPSARYQWTGEVLMSPEGIALDRGCDTWMLRFETDDLRTKVTERVGEKMYIWGSVTRDSIGGPTIVVEQAYTIDDPMPKILVPDYPCYTEPVEQLYSWVGVVVVSDIEGRHLELNRDCDTWVLLPESEEVAQKMEAFIGEKLTVWGVVSTDPNIYMRQTIAVRSAHGPDEPIIMLYVPEYPCPGVVVPPEPPVYYPAEIDLLAGEIAAVGRVVWEGERMYLETASGRIVLNYSEPGVVAVPPTLPGEVGADGVVASDLPSYADGAEVLVAGRWLVEEGQLTIVVRYIRSWGYDYPEPVPPPEPGDTMGTLYGQVRIGPLCPVEPCPAPVPDVYSTRSLILESEAGETTEVPLAADWSMAQLVPLIADGWFKAQVEPGVYTVTLTDCAFLGCETALPQKVEVLANEATELLIDIDTGIR